MPNALVLLPTYNERENLGRLVPRLSALPEPVDVLVIDDSSPDGTGDLAEDLSRRYARLSVLHRREKEGLGRAYVEGFREGLRRGYRRLVTMDADLSHSPEDVPRLLGALDEADVALGSRHAPGGGVEGWPLGRRLLSGAGSLYARSLLRLPVRDATGGFRAYRSEALEDLDLSLLRAQGFVFQVEILRRLLDLPGARAIEVPIVFRDRTLGRSKMSGRIVREAVVEVAALALRRRRQPARRYERAESPGASLPRASVVVPARPGSGAPAALEGIGGLRYPPERLEVVVARGLSPSRQRNEAVWATRGDLILFLDDDSAPSADLLARYAESFRRDPTLAAVGGPSESRPGSPFQELASLVLGEEWVMGRSASRYRARGALRFTDERELILCNLALRRSAFEDAGGFDESFYPNEENDLLERLARAGWRLLYRPEALVRRPARASPRALLGAVWGYGRGRARQVRALPSRTSWGRVLGALLGACGLGAVVLGILGGSTLSLVPAALYGTYLALLALKLSLRAGPAKGGAGAALAALVHGAYALGLLAGLVGGLFGSVRRLLSRGRKETARPECPVAIERVDVEGNRSESRARAEAASDPRRKEELQ